MDPAVVTAVPILRWIDVWTLGFFAQYRRVPPGDPALKTDSDLDPIQRDCMSVMLSPEGFQQVYGCPSVRSYVLDTVGKPIYDNFLAEEKAKAGSAGEPTQAQNNAATARLNAFFDSPDGKRLLADQTPPPCGTGALTQHVNPPDPFPGTDANVREISVGLETGKIKVYFHADAEIFCGNVDVSQTIHFPLSVDTGVVKIGKPERDSPSTNISGGLLCKAALAAVGVAVAGLTGGLTGFLTLVFVHSFLEDPVGKKISEIEFKPNELSPQTGQPVSWTGITCDETGLVLRGHIYINVADPKPFNPTVEITAQQKPHTPIFGPIPDGETDHLTGIACVPPAGTVFHFTRGATDWETTLGLQSQDVPLPLAVGGWYVQFGWRTKVGGYLTAEYDANTFKLEPGALKVGGTVWDPEPPLEGALVENTTISLDVAAAAQPGFVLKSSHGDLNYYMRITTTVMDAGGRVWNPSLRVAIDGKTITLGDDITQFIKECDKLLGDLNQRFAKSHHVPPWQEGTNISERVQQELLNGLRDGTVGIASILSEASAKIGEVTIYNLIVGNKGTAGR